MPVFLYRCPYTGLNVQGWVADDPEAAETGATYVSVTCVACTRMHLVNPRTEKVLGSEDE